MILIMALLFSAILSSPAEAASTGEASRPAAPAPQYKVSVDWNCGQSIVGKQAPSDIQGGKINFYFEVISKNPSTIRLAMGNFKSFLRGLENNSPSVDFYECGREVLLALDAQIADKKIIEPELIDSLRDDLVKYGRRAFDRGARSPFVPLEKSWRPLSDQQTLARVCQAPWSSSEKAYFGSESFIRDKIPKYNIDDQCRASMDQQYAKIFLGARLTDKQCAVNRANCSLMREASKRGLKLIGSALRTPVTTSLASLMEQCDRPIETLQHALEDWLDQAIKVDACVKLSPDEERAGVFNPTRSGRKYSLRRMKDVAGNDVYVAAIPLRFADSSGGRGPEVQSEMLDRARTCFRNAEPFLGGPNGERLKVQLLDGTVSDDASPISVVSKIDRPDSAHWDTNVDCRTVLHEVFHLFGLVDLYREREAYRTEFKTGKPPASWDCRPIGPDDSIMSDQGQAIVAISSQLEVHLCTCDSPDAKTSQASLDTCLADVRAMDTAKSQANRKCPASSHQLIQSGLTSFGIMDPKSSDARAYDKIRGGMNFKPEMTSIFVKTVSPPRRGSLLYPAEFRLITQPGCMAENLSYCRCSRNSYRTSRDNLGQGCLESPPECSNGNLDWLLR